MSDLASVFPADAIALGRTQDAHGLRGQLSIIPFSDEPSGLLKVRAWWLVPYLASAPDTILFNKARAFAVTQAKLHGNTVVATLLDVVDRDTAESLKNHTVYVSKAALPVAQAGEYYWTDLIGCTVIAADQSVLGTVTEVTSNGPQSILNVGQNYAESAQAKVVHLIPFVAAYVGDVDMVKKTIHTQWLASYSD